MSISDTLKAQKYAAIAEIAAAQSKLYADKLESAPDYAAQAAASASLAATSATQAESAALTSVSAANSATASAISAASSAESAGEAAADAIQNYVDQSVRVSDPETLNPVPAASSRANTVFLWDGASQPTGKPLSEFATLDGTGKIPVSMIPAIALTEPFVVSSQAAMLALNAQVGDIAKRTDLGYSFCLASSPPSTLSNWVQLTDDVLAQLGLASGAAMVGAVDDSSNPTTVQGALNLKTSIASLAASTGATIIGATNNAGSTSTVQSVLNLKLEKTELAANDGEKFIGSCPSIATLRTIEPVSNGQRITLSEHTTGTGYGGGQFRAILSGSGYTDNNGTIIKTTGGAAWLRIGADSFVTPSMFGAQMLSTASDHAAINSALATGKDVNLEGLVYYVNNTLVMDVNGTRLYNGSIRFMDNSTTIFRIGGIRSVIDHVNFDGALQVNGENGYGLRITGAYSTVSNCRIQSIPRSGVSIGASGCVVRDCLLDFCGNGTAAAGNDRCSIIVDEFSYNTVDNCELTRCNWGVYFRADIAGVRQSNNKIINCRIRGQKSRGTQTDAQGISASNQYGLVQQNNRVFDFNDNGIDNQFCNNSFITNNTVANCNDAVFLGDRSCQFHTVIGNSIDSCVSGVRLTTYPDATLRGCVVVGNTILNCQSQAAVRLERDASSPNTSALIDCIVSNNVIEWTSYSGLPSSCRGIYAKNANSCTITGNVIRNAPGEGVRIEGGVMNTASNNTIQDVNRASSGLNAITIGTSTESIAPDAMMILDNRTYGGAAYSVYVATGGNHTVRGTRYRSMISGGVNIQAGVTGVTQSDNVSF